MGINKQDSGKVFFNGNDISELPINERAKMGISFAFQQPVKFKGIAVYDLIRLSSEKDISKKEACQILSKVGLCAKEYVDREINASLSGGELKRIEIATVAVRNSNLTIFDEPEAGIDLWSFSNLIGVFESMREKTHGDIVIISHQERILSVADEIIVLSGGKVQKQGARAEILPAILNSGATCKTLESKLEKAAQAGAARQERA